MRISQQIFPRVVCLVTTVNDKGEPNVMTVSFIMPISFEPKYLAFSISPERYSFENLQSVKEFGVNVCSRELKTVAWICGTRSGRDMNKFELAKISIEKSKVIKPPIIKECPISFECRIEWMRLFGDHYLVVGRVVYEHIRKSKFTPLMHKTGREFF